MWLHQLTDHYKELAYLEGAQENWITPLYMTAGTQSQPLEE
jgi:hypothetical protein